MFEGTTGFQWTWGIVVSWRQGGQLRGWVKGSLKSCSSRVCWVTNMQSRQIRTNHSRHWNERENAIGNGLERGFSHQRRARNGRRKLQHLLGVRYASRKRASPTLLARIHRHDIPLGLACRCLRIASPRLLVSLWNKRRIVVDDKAPNDVCDLVVFMWKYYMKNKVYYGASQIHTKYLVWTNQFARFKSAVH